MKHLMWGVLTLLFMGATPVAATTYYVGKSGNDSNSCGTAQSSAAGSRKLTVFGASGGKSCLAAGDTLLIGNGTYAENLSGTLPSGSSGNPTTIKAESPLGATLTGCGSGIGGVYLTATNWITFDGLVLDSSGCNGAVFLIGNSGANAVHNLTITNSHLIGTHTCPTGTSDCSCIMFGGGNTDCSDITITNNEIEQCATDETTNQNHGIYAANDRMTIVNNTIHDVGGGYCVHAYGQSHTVLGSVIERNTLYNCGTAATGATAVLLGSTSGALVVGNTMRNSGGGGVRAYSGDVNFTIANNSVYGRGASDWCVRTEAGGSGGKVQNNACDNTPGGISITAGTATADHNVTSGVNFTAPASGNFTLATGSAAIDAGVALSPCPAGWSCAYNGSAPDAGAIESTGASPSGTTAVQVSFVYGPVDSQHAAATGATVKWRALGGGWATYCQTAAPTAACTGAGLANGATYEFTVTTTNSTGTGPASSTVSVALGTPPTGGVPSPASNVVAAPLTARTTKPKEPPPSAATDVQAQPGGTP